MRIRWGQWESGCFDGDPEIMTREEQEVTAVTRKG